MNIWNSCLIRLEKSNFLWSTYNQFKLGLKTGLMVDFLNDRSDNFQMAFEKIEEALKYKNEFKNRRNSENLIRIYWKSIDLAKLIFQFWFFETKSSKFLRNQFKSIPIDWKIRRNRHYISIPNLPLVPHRPYGDLGGAPVSQFGLLDSEDVPMQRPPLRPIDKYIRPECPCLTKRYTVAVLTCCGKSTFLCTNI